MRAGEVSAPIVIGRDHMESGSVGNPNRETEGIRDGSDAVSDWPLLNAMLNVAAIGITLNPARKHGLDGRKGSIAAGKDADLMLLDKHMEVQATLVAGEEVYIR